MGAKEPFPSYRRQTGSRMDFVRRNGRIAYTSNSRFLTRGQAHHLVDASSRETTGHTRYEQAICSICTGARVQAADEGEISLIHGEAGNTALAQLVRSSLCGGCLKQQLPSWHTKRSIPPVAAPCYRSGGLPRGSAIGGPMHLAVCPKRFSWPAVKPLPRGDDNSCAAPTETCRASILLVAIPSCHLGSTPNMSSRRSIVPVSGESKKTLTLCKDEPCMACWRRLHPNNHKRHRQGSRCGG